MHKPATPELTTDQIDWLKSAPKFPEEFTVTSSKGAATYRILDRDASGKIAGLNNRMGSKGFVLRVEDAETGAVYAAKICVPEDYADDRTEFVETKLANKLRGAEGLFVLPERAGRTDRFSGMPGVQNSFVCFISEWVEGETLEQRCNSNTKHIDPEFICSATLEVLRAIRFLESRGLKHDDLHWGNVMIRVKDPDLALLAEDKLELRISIIDMGSLKQWDHQTKKSKDDTLSLLQIMVNLFNIAWGRRQIAAIYPGFISGYRRVIEQMADEDHLRFFTTEDALPRAINTLRENLKNIQLPLLNRPFQPFEAISAEHLADDATLLRLFEDSLPWFQSILEPKPIVLTGPRGCGKSMLFRYMAAKTHLAPLPKKPNSNSKLNSFGVYVSCATHLQNNLIWIARKPGRVREHAESISTFFQLVVVRELLRSLAVAYQDENAKANYGLTDNGVDELVTFIEQYFNDPVETPRLTSKPRLLHFADDIDRLRVTLHLDLLNQRPTRIVLTDTFLGDITTKLQSAFPRFNKAAIVFLLDDYTANRVHPDIQAILNRIIFERRDSHYFKISCEKFGFSPDDIDGVRIDSSREYVEIDAGSYAMSEPSETNIKQFISGLIDRRLEVAGWIGRAETLIGKSKEFSDDTKLALYIRHEGSKQGRHYYYFGMDHLARLWSGDIATILQIIKEMFVLGHVTDTSTEAIPRNIQHQAIVSVSRAFKERVSGYHPFGPEMASLLNNLGTMARDVLVSGLLDGNSIPRRLYRMEMTKDRPESLLSMLNAQNPSASNLARELLRRAVFIQLPDSRGKEGHGSQTVRWELRKVYLPAFGTSLERSSYIHVKTLDDFIHLLTDSRGFCTNIQAKYLLSKKQDRATASLFDDDDEG